MGGRNQEASNTVTEVLEQLTATHGNESPLLVPALLAQVEVQRSVADMAMALETLSRHRASGEKNQRPEHPDNITLRVSRANILLDAGRIADAQSLLNSANVQLRRLAANNFLLGSDPIGIGSSCPRKERVGRRRQILERERAAHRNLLRRTHCVFA